MMKQTEIGQIPEDWEVKKLGELGEVKMCRRVFQYQTSEYGEIPFFKIGTFGKEPDAYICRELFEEFKAKFPYPKVGEILISAAGTIGRIVVYNGDESYFQDSNIVWIENREDIISNKLLKYVLEVIKYNTEGGTIQRLYNGILKSTLFVCPPFSEQQAIAEVLSDTDHWITSLEDLIAKKQLIKQGAMQKLLTPKDDWEVKKIREIAKVGRGRVISHKEINNSQSKKYPVYSSQTTNNGVMGFIDTYDFDGEYVTWTTDGEKAGTVFHRIGRFNCTNVCGTIKLVKDNPKFICYILGTVTPKHVSRNLANPKLMNEPMKNIELAIPSLPEQERIATILSDMDAEIEALEQKLIKARQIKQGLMQELLTGRIRLVQSNSTKTAKEL